MTLLDFRNDSYVEKGFNERQAAIIEAVLAQNLDSGESNKDVADRLGISERTFYREKQNPKVVQAIVETTEQKAKLLLPLAVSKAESLLSDPDTPATAAVALIKTVLQGAGLSKPDEDDKAIRADTAASNLDKLIEHYSKKQ